MNAWAEWKRGVAAYASIEEERQQLFMRMRQHGIIVVPFAGLSFLWSILREVEHGGN